MNGQAATESLVARLYDARGPDRTIDLAERPDKLRDDQLLWVDVAERDRAAVGRLCEVLDLRPGTIQALTDPPSELLVRRHDAYLHVGLRSVEEHDEPGRGAGNGPGALRVVRIDLIAAPNVVMTVRDGPVRAFERFQGEIEDVSQLGRLDAAGFVSALLDAVLGEYLRLVEDLERRIDRLDVVALRARRPNAVLDQLVALRLRAAIMRRALAPHRPAFAALARPDFVVHDGLGEPWPDLAERLDTTLDAIESARELLLGTHDLVMTKVAQRTNDTMKTLTILSAVILPASLLASILGMNFALPLFADLGNFWIAVGVMAALMVATLVIALVRDRARGAV